MVIASQVSVGSSTSTLMLKQLLLTISSLRVAYLIQRRGFAKTDLKTDSIFSYSIPATSFWASMNLTK